jgi:hypothetical protein
MIEVAGKSSLRVIPPVLLAPPVLVPPPPLVEPPPVPEPPELPAPADPVDVEVLVPDELEEHAVTNPIEPPAAIQIITLRAIIAFSPRSLPNDRRRSLTLGESRDPATPSVELPFMLSGAREASGASSRLIGSRPVSKHDLIGD